MIVFVLILLAASAVDGQLEFNYTQTGESLDLNCTLANIGLTDLAFLTTLKLSKLDGSTQQVLASVASFGASQPVVDPSLADATVQTSISQDGSTPTYIRVHWDEAGHYTSGEYTCTLSGLNNQNAPTEVAEILPVQFVDVNPTLTTTPTVLELGLSTQLDVNCYIPDMKLAGISRVTAMELSYVHEGRQQLLASVDSFTGLENKPGSGVYQLDGQVGNSSQSNYIQGLWKYPTMNNVGIYQCGIYGIADNGTVIYIELTLNVSSVDPPKDELINRIQDLQTLNDQMTLQNQNLTDQLNTSGFHLKVLVESSKGYKICDDVDLPVGQYPITLFPDDGLGVIRVICDVTAPGEVWTMFQKRYDGSLDFYRNFTEYQTGFGSLDKEFWLGLKNLNRIMGIEQYQLRVDMIDYNKLHHTRIYPKFEVGSGDAYELYVAGYDDGGHGLSFNNGAEFSTFDHGPEPYCAKSDFGGWWYSNCAFANLNGKWGKVGEPGVTWYELHGSRTHTLQRTEMKFRRQ